MAMKGMISSVTERFRDVGQNLHGPYVTSYGYDPLYQLTSAAYPSFDAALNVPWSGQTHSWSYDAIGNRLSYTKTGAGTPDVATYTYNLNNKGPQLAGITHSNGEPSLSFTYDNNGNTLTQAVTGGATTTYTWDQDDKMTGFTTSDNSQSAAYIYAYNGDRLQRTMNGTTWSYLYSKEDIFKIDQGGANPMYLTQGPGIDDVLAETAGSNTNYAYKNMLSSVMQLATSTGSVVRNYNYSAWGESTNWPNPTLDQNPYGYTGREWESPNSYYYRARVYMPGVGRFVSRDPIKATPIYCYVKSGPVYHKDPSGLIFPGEDMPPDSYPNRVAPGCAKCPGGRWVGTYIDATGMFLRGSSAGTGTLYCGPYKCQVAWTCFLQGYGSGDMPVWPGSNIGVGITYGVGLGGIAIWGATSGSGLESTGIAFGAAAGGARDVLGVEGSFGASSLSAGLSFGVGGNLGAGVCHISVPGCWGP